MVSDNIGFVLDYGFSQLDRNDIDYESYAGTGRGGTGAQDTLNFTFRENGQYSIDGALDYTNPQNVLLTDPGGWGQVGFIKQPEIEDELQQIRAETRYEFDGGLLADIRFGYLYTDRNKRFDSNESFLRQSAAFTNGSLAVPSTAIVGTTDSGNLGQNLLAYDPSGFLTDGTYVVEKANFDVQWRVEEEVHNFYVQANIDGMLGSIPVRGNIGLRYADTKQGSTGTIGQGLVNRVRFSYDDWLPSANLSFEVAEDTYVRLAAARSITRARLDQMAANQSIGTNPTSCVDSDNDQFIDTLIAYSAPDNVCFSVGGGNTFLQPYASTSFDVSFEKYFSAGTAIIVAGFHKELSDWVVDGSELTDISQQIRNSGNGQFLEANPEVAIGFRGGPTNFAEGSITGVEGTVRLDFGDLSNALEGFGGFASITYADASITDEVNGSTKIPGYSELTWSADLFYEKNGFRAKLAARYRDAFLSEVQNFDGSLSGADALDETILDAQIGYTFQNESGPLKGLGLLFEVFNLTNEPFSTENDLFDGNGFEPSNVIGTFPSRHELYGRTFNFTIRKNF